MVWAAPIADELPATVITPAAETLPLEIKLVVTINDAKAEQQDPRPLLTCAASVTEVRAELAPRISSVTRARII